MNSHQYSFQPAPRKKNKIGYGLIGWMLLIIAQSTILLAAGSDKPTIFDESIRYQARCDAVDDFKVRPWQLKMGGVQFCSLFLVGGTGLIPEYPYQSKALELTVVTALPIAWAYRRDVTIPIDRKNQATLSGEHYSRIYLSEYETSIRQLRIFNGLAGAAVFGLTLVIVKALF